MSSPCRDPPSPALTRRQRLAVLLLSAWFFVITMTLWLLKPIRTAALLTHLGSLELPYLRAGSVLVVGAIVFGYSRVVSRASRLRVALGASGTFFGLVSAVWLGLRVWGEALGQQRWFVWAVFCLVDAYAAVMVTLFWTYANDVVTRVEADRLYSYIGVGGILGGIAGGVAMDALVGWLGPLRLLLVCAGSIALGGALAWVAETRLEPPPRPLPARPATPGGEALEGVRRVLRDRYLSYLVGIVVAYESAAAASDFVVNVVFERAFPNELILAQMYGRLGWIVSATALASQLLIVPALLPQKRTALLVPPLLMIAATLSLALMPVVSLAIALAASDRGINYSLQQVTKETLYIPLGDTERYNAKAFIDIFADRAAKAVASLALLVVMVATGAPLAAGLGLSLCALALWARCAHALGKAYVERIAREAVRPSLDRVRADEGTALRGTNFAGLDPSPSSQRATPRPGPEVDMQTTPIEADIEARSSR